MITPFELQRNQKKLRIPLLVHVVSLVFILASNLAFADQAKFLCDGQKYDDLSKSFATTNTDKNTEWLKTLMSFSYGEEAKRFVEMADGGLSLIYSTGKAKKRKPLVTTLMVTFRTKEDAGLAHQFMKKRWDKSPYHSVFAHNRTVFWMGNNSVTDKCFKFFSSNAPKAIAALHPQDG